MTMMSILNLSVRVCGIDFIKCFRKFLHIFYMVMTHLA